MTGYRFNRALLCASAMTSLQLLLPHAALAQDSSATPSATPTKASAVQREADAGDITVTARRRSESLVDVPLAISVVTSAKLEQLDIRDTATLANYVPGLQFSDFTPGYSRNDRGGTRPLIFRGLNVGTGGSVTAAGGLFLDGAAVVGNEVPAGMDIGQVEILRGPQSVYFGRSTMTGAVSYRTKSIPDSWGGEVEASLAQRNDERIEASIAGPLVPGLLKIRVTGLAESSDGYVTNTYNNGAGKLGDRSRNSISTTVDFTPAEGLEFKGYANYFHDDDGPSATAFVPATLANCIVPGAVRPTFCGEIPGRSHSINYFNTTIPANFSNAIFASPLIKGAGFKDKVGLQRNVVNSHIVSSYEISDYLKVQAITGYHTNVTLQTADGITQPVQSNFPYSQYFYTIVNKSRDFSQELRLNSDPNRMFSWTAGTNYVNAYNKTNAITAFGDQVNGVPTTFRPIAQNITSDEAKTYGFFGGGYLKLFDNKLTLSAEGRYQIDKRSNVQTTIAGAELADLQGTFRSFNPRVSVDYDLGGRRKIYASYATGTRPGGFNALLKTYLDRNIPALTADIQHELGATTFTYKEERLKIGELGFKGNFAGGKGYFDLNTYYGKLSNQQIGYGALIPYLGFTVTTISNIGETTLYGVEAQGNYNFTESLSLATTFAWNHTDRNKYTNTSGLLQFGTTNFDGVQMPNTPQFSGSAVLSYNHKLTQDWDFFTNGSYVYRGKQFTDTANLSYIHGRSQVDLRAGVSNDRYTIEGFVTNVLGNRSYTAGNVAPDFGGSPTYTAFFGAYAPPRQFGGRLRVKI